MTAGVVAALRVEARTLGPSTRRGGNVLAAADGSLIAVSGMGERAAAAAARVLLDAGANALVSWGMAGGLDPALRAGSLCLPALIVATDGRSYPTDAHWRALAAAAVASQRPVFEGSLLSSTCAISTADGKAAALRATGAQAVDMESAAVAGVAAGARVPFIAVRAIVDTAADSLPQAVTDATRGETLCVRCLLGSLLKRPGDLASLFQLAGRYRAAARSLSAVARSGALAPLVFAASASRHA